MDVNSIRLGLAVLQTCAVLLAANGQTLSANQSQPEKAATRQQQQLAEWRQLISAEPQFSPADPCRRLNIIDRRNWSAKSPTAALHSFASRPQRVIIHQAWDGRTCADLDSCSVRLRAIQAYHQYSKLWPDIGYNFLISGDGTIFEGLGFAKMGFHTLNYNHDSLGIALIGTFQDVQPTAAMERALGQLLDCGQRSGKLAAQYQLHGHRDARCTICPGEAAYRRLATMARFRPGPLARYSCPAGPSAGLVAATSRERNLTSDDAGDLDRFQLASSAATSGKRAADLARPVEPAAAATVEEEAAAAFVGVVTRRRLTTLGQQPAPASEQQVATSQATPMADGRLRRPTQRTSTPAPATTTTAEPSRHKVLLINIQQLAQAAGGHSPMGGATSALFYVLRPQPTSGAPGHKLSGQPSRWPAPGSGSPSGTTSASEPDDGEAEEPTAPEVEMEIEEQQSEESPVKMAGKASGKAAAAAVAAAPAKADGVGQQVAPSNNGANGMLALLERLLDKMSFLGNLTLF